MTDFNVNSDKESPRLEEVNFMGISMMERSEIRDPDERRSKIKAFWITVV